MTEVGGGNNAISLECHVVRAVSCTMIDSPWLFAIVEIPYLSQDDVDSFAVLIHSGVGLHLLNRRLLNGKIPGLLVAAHVNQQTVVTFGDLCGQNVATVRKKEISG